MHVHAQCFLRALISLPVLFCMFCELDKELCQYDSVITRLLKLKKYLHKIGGQHRQNAEPGQTLRQAGNKPEGTLTSQAWYRMLINSEHNSCTQKFRYM